MRSKMKKRKRKKSGSRKRNRRNRKKGFDFNKNNAKEIIEMNRIGIARNKYVLRYIDTELRYGDHVSPHPQNCICHYV